MKPTKSLPHGKANGLSTDRLPNTSSDQQITLTQTRVGILSQAHAASKLAIVVVCLVAVLCVIVNPAWLSPDAMHFVIAVLTIAAAALGINLYNHTR